MTRLQAATQPVELKTLGGQVVGYGIDPRRIVAVCIAGTIVELERRGLIELGSIE